MYIKCASKVAKLHLRVLC